MRTISPQVADPPRLRITDVECHVLLAPDMDPSLTSSAQDSLIVVVGTDRGSRAWASPTPTRG